MYQQPTIHRAKSKRKYSKNIQEKYILSKFGSMEAVGCYNSGRTSDGFEIRYYLTIIIFSVLK